MFGRSRSMLCLVFLVGVAVATCADPSLAAAGDAKLPDAVAETFKAAFPKGEIHKLDVEEEDGVTIYDLEFKDGEVEKEVDIAVDGTILDSTIVIDPKTVPTRAMKAVRKAARGATLGRTERIEVHYETKEGKLIKLPHPLTHYAVELAKGDQKAEVVVGPDGKVVESPKWTPAKTEKSAGKTG